MRPKIVSGILVLLLLTSFLIATINVAGIFAFSNVSTETQNSASNLLKGVDFNKTQDTLDSTSKGSTNFWDFNNTSPQNTSTTPWGSNSNQFIIGVSDAWQSYGKLEQFAAAENVKIINKVLMGNTIGAIVVNTTQNNVVSFMQDIKNAGLNTYIEPRGTYQAFMIPNDTYWGNQWGPGKINATSAWDITTGNKTRVLVAVVDTGVDYGHPDIAPNYVPLGYDWVNNDSYPLDDNGHGTHVAGIIGAVINNDIGIAGLAQVRIMAEKGIDASGSGYYDVLAQAIIDATNKNASIINMSWGGTSPSKTVEDALKYAYDHGVLLVAAAGNSGSSVKSYPAAYSNEVVAVTATDANDTPAYFTSYGDWVELAAPGVDIFSTLPTYHVTLNDPPYSRGLNYDYLSGTSMACPHVVGVAALVWSRFPGMSRDVLRLRLRDTADDLGTPGFDIYYGYGRINALKALTQSFPPHDILIASWEKPPFVEPNATGIINATIVNYGSNNETNVNIELLINDTVEKSENITNFLSGTSTKFNFSWTPTIIGNYNVTIYAVPATNETNTKNNIVQGFVYVGIPLRVFVLRSAGTQLVTSAWDELNYNWQRYGNRIIYIDYTTLDKDNITYADLNATKADVLILSCAFMWNYTDAEIDAIKQYVYEGHGFIATAGTFYYQVPNNNKFLPLLGMNESAQYSATYTDLLNLLEPPHPLFTGVPNPYTMPAVGTAYPNDGYWSSNELAGGTYVAMGYYNESVIVTYQGLVYISPWLEAIPEHYNFNLQILYNAITWSRYMNPPDITPPTLQILSPGNNSYIHHVVAINVSGFDDNFDHMNLLVDSQLVTTFRESGVYTYLWNTSAEQYGVHRITLAGYDSVGNSANVSITVTVDNISPTANILSPANATYVRGNITITFIDQDTALKNASITIGDEYRNVTGMNSMSFNTTLLTDGIYRVKLEVYDLAGNKAETFVTIAIDNTIPSAQITNPSNSAFVRGSAGIDVSYDDEYLKEAVLSIDGATRVMFIDNRPFGQTLVSVHLINPMYTWDTTTATDGMHTITLTVSDYAGNTKTIEIQVFVDNTSPIGGILSPSNSACVKGNVDITAYGFDANLANMSLLVDGSSILQTWYSSETHDYSWNTTTATDGLHTITLTAYDEAGNQFTTVVTVIVDNTLPTISIISPQNSSSMSLTGVVNITFSAADNNQLDTLRLFIDNMQTIIYANQVYKWDTTKVVDGNHTIRIVATDIAGNTNEQTITVKTANATPAILTIIGYASVAILGLALGALAVWTLLRRRQLSSKPAA